MSDPVKHAVKDTKDAINESLHRSSAEGEKAKRELLGDEMTAGEKAKSAANQVKETAQAEYDHAKRKARDAT